MHPSLNRRHKPTLNLSLCTELILNLRLSFPRVMGKADEKSKVDPSTPKEPIGAEVEVLRDFILAEKATVGMHENF